MKYPFALFFFYIIVLLSTCSSGNKPTKVAATKSLFPKGETIDTMINVGSHDLHFRITGGEGLPILFESGGGNDASAWEHLLEPLYDSLGATLITYDRAGFGTSGIDTNRINLLTEVADLHAALAMLGFGEEVMLVAHSLGGSYAMIYAAHYPENVKASVFIDITLPCFFNEQRTEEAIAEMAAYGIENIKAEKPGFYYIFTNYAHTNQVVRETAYPASIPTTIIAAGIPPKALEEDNLAWKACQEEFGNLPRHRFVLAENTSHNVHQDNPALVIEEIIKAYPK